MSTTFLVSDTHFGHTGVCRFMRRDGVTKLRPWDDADEMNEDMVKAWNDRVRPNDKVYHLGDVVINRKYLPILHRLNGDKVLIKGNHDIFKLEDYTQYFRDIRGYHVLNGMILSHIPIHEESISRFGTNIHGHLHERRVMTRSQWGNTKQFDESIDPRYHCVCVEQTNWAPISLEEVVKRITEEGGQVGFKERNQVYAD